MKKINKITSDKSEKESSEHIISKENAEELLKVMLEGIEDALLKGESVKIDNVGTFSLQKKEAKIDEIPPVTEEVKKQEIKIPEKKVSVQEAPEKKVVEASNQPKTDEIPPLPKKDRKKIFSFEEGIRPVKKFRIRKEVILFFIIILVPLMMLFYFLIPGFHSTVNRVFLGQDSELPQKNYFESESDLSLVNAYLDSIRNDSILREEQYNLTIENLRVYNEMITEFTTENDMTLEQISKEYYGNEIFWVYIYDANKENLTGLRRVKKGTLISVPKIPEDLLDTNNQKSSDIAYKMMEIILKEKDQKRIENKVIGDVQQPEPAKVTNEVPEISAEKTVAVTPKTAKSTVVAPKTTNTSTVTPKTTTSKTVTQSSQPNNAVKTAVTTVSTPVEPVEKLSKTPAMVVLGEGERLTMYAKKYYGNKDFWVYIYEANKDVISNPNNVPAGTTIQIPSLGPDKIDASNPECLRKAKLLHEKYVKRAQ